MTISQRFDALLANLELKPYQVEDGKTKYKGVTRCLNARYYYSNSETANGILVGSWGKQTQIRPPRDVDILFQLPKSVYDRFQSRFGNRQSQLLQEVKDVLTGTYSATKMRGDGQVVIVPFATHTVEVVPAFLLDNTQYWVCNTHDGGKYVNFDPTAEANSVSSSEGANRNTRDLIKMLKCWQGYCSVPLKSFHLELLAVEFLRKWEHAGHTTVYYDWMVRDVFKFMVGRANGWLFAPAL
jgi:hypothetical protein